MRPPGQLIRTPTSSNSGETNRTIRRQNIQGGGGDLGTVLTLYGKIERWGNVETVCCPDMGRGQWKNQGWVGRWENGGLVRVYIGGRRGGGGGGGEEWKAAYVVLRGTVLSVRKARCSAPAMCRRAC